MISTTRRLSLAGLVLAGAHGVARSAAPDDDGSVPWPRSRPTPALALPRWEGEPWRLADQQGQIVLLHFWASWCEPCRTELPALELLAHRHERDGLQVMAINYRETDAALRRFFDAMPCSLPILRDQDGRAAQAWSVRIFPTTVVVGRDGRARRTFMGAIDWNHGPARRWLQQLVESSHRARAPSLPPPYPSV